MQELEKTLLKETEQLVNMHYEDDSVKTIILRNLRDIRKHMPGKDTNVPTNDGWIPVEDRLPEGRTRVICQFDNGDIELLWQDWESDTESLTYWTDFDFMAEKKVIAWRPLPDPYQTERRR